VVGGTAILFSDVGDEGTTTTTTPDTTIQSIRNFPCDPGFLPWTLLFSCSLAHPTVMFRLSNVVSALRQDGDVGSTTTTATDVVTIYRPEETPAE